MSRHKITTVLLCGAFPLLLTARTMLAVWNVAKSIARSVHEEGRDIGRNCSEFFTAVGHKWRNKKCAHGRVIGVQSCRECSLGRIFDRRKENEC